MEWLRTLVWIFRGGEKSLIAFIAVATALAWVVPMDQQAQDMQLERAAMSANQGEE